MSQGIFSQLWLVIKKNFTIRKRQPFILSLEFLWPLLVFLIMLGIRYTFKEEEKQMCTYKARAMPSAGMLPFLQSFVCTLNNPCEDMRSYEPIPSYPQAQIGNIVTQLKPIVENENITDVITSLPKGIRLLETVVDTLNEKPVQKLIKEGIKVSGIIKDEAPFLYILTDDLGALTYSETKQLLNATVDLQKLLEFMQEDNSFEDLLCGGLESVLHLPNRKVVEGISQKLCELSAEDKARVKQLLLDELDISGLIRIVADLFGSLGKYELETALNDISKMIDSVLELSSLKSLANVTVAQWIPPLVSFFNSLSSSNIDFSVFDTILNDLEDLFKDDANWKEIAVVLHKASEVIGWLESSVEKIPILGDTLGDILETNGSLEGLLVEVLGLTPDLVVLVMTSPVKPKYLTALKEAKNPEEIRRILCEEPGYLGILDTSRARGIDMEKLQSTQELLCNNLHVDEFTEQLKKIFQYQKLTEAIDSKDSPSRFSLTTLLDNTEDLVKGLHTLTTSLRPVLPVLEKVWQSLEITVPVLLRENWSRINYYDFLPLLDAIKAWIPQPQRDMISQYTVYANLVMDASFQSINITIGLPPRLNQILLDNIPVVKNFLKLGPEFLSAFLDSVTDSSRLQMLIKSRKDLRRLFCDTKNLEKFVNLPKSLKVAQVKGVLCDDEWLDVAADIMSQFQVDQLYQSVNTLLNMKTRDLPSTKFTELASLARLVNTTDALIRTLASPSWKLAYRDSLWNNLEKKISPNISTTAWLQKWGQELADNFTEKDLVTTVLTVYLEVFGELAPESHLWPDIQNVLRKQGAFFKAFKKEMTSTTSGFVWSIIENLPDVLETLLLTLKNSEKISKLLHIKNGKEVFCNYKKIPEYFDLPSHVEPQDFQLFTCTVYGTLSKIIAGKPLESPLANYIELVSAGTIRYPEHLDMEVYKEETRDFISFMKNLEVSMARSFDPNRFAGVKKAWQEFDFSSGLADVIFLSLQGTVKILEIVDEQISAKGYNWVWVNVKAMFGLLDVTVQTVDDVAKNVSDKNSLEVSDILFNSPTLTAMGKNVLSLLPGFIDSLNRVLTTELLQVFSGVPEYWRNNTHWPCQSSNLDHLLGMDEEWSISLRDLEKMLCNKILDIPSELARNPSAKKIMEIFTLASNGSDVTINWRSVSSNILSLMDNLEQLKNFDGSIFPDAPLFTVNELKRSLESMSEDLQSSYRTMPDLLLRLALQCVDVTFILYQKIDPGYYRHLKAFDKWKSSMYDAWKEIYEKHSYTYELADDEIDDVDMYRYMRTFTDVAVLKYAIASADSIADVVGKMLKSLSDGDSVIDALNLDEKSPFVRIFVDLPDYYSILFHTLADPGIYKKLSLLIYRGVRGYQQYELSSPEYRSCMEDPVTCLDDVCQYPEEWFVVPQESMISHQQLGSFVCGVINMTRSSTITDQLTFYGIQNTYILNLIRRLQHQWVTQSPLEVPAKFTSAVFAIKNLIEFPPTNMNIHFGPNATIDSSSRWRNLGVKIGELVSSSWKHWIPSVLSNMQPLVDAGRSDRLVAVLINHLLERINRYFNNLLYGGVVRLEDIFIDAPSLHDLVETIDSHFIDILAVFSETNTATPYKLKRLANYAQIGNFTEICERPEGFFSVPKYLELNLAEIVTPFCNINTSRLLHELTDDEFMNFLVNDTGADINMTDLGDSIVELVSNFIEMAQHQVYHTEPLYQFESVQLFNATKWGETFNGWKSSWRTSYYNYKDLDMWWELLLNTLIQLHPVVRSLGTVAVDKVALGTKWFNERIQLFEVPVLSFDAVLQNFPELLKVSVIMDEKLMVAMDVMVYNAMKTPDKVVTFIRDFSYGYEGMFERFCTADLLPKSFPENETLIQDAKEMQNQICTVKVAALKEEALSFIGYKDFMKLISLSEDPLNETTSLKIQENQLYQTSSPWIEESESYLLNVHGYPYPGQYPFDKHGYPGHDSFNDYGHPGQLSFNDYGYLGNDSFDHYGYPGHDSVDHYAYPDQKYLYYQNSRDLVKEAKEYDDLITMYSGLVNNLKSSYAAIQNISANPPRLDSSAVPNWMKREAWELFFDRTRSRISAIEFPNPILTTAVMLVEEWGYRDVLTFTKYIFDALNARLANLKANVKQLHLLQLLEEYPHMKELAEILQSNFPDVVESVVLTIFKRPALIDYIYYEFERNPNELCESPFDKYFVEPSSGLTAVEDVRNKLCTFNYTALEEEAKKYIGFTDIGYEFQNFRHWPSANSTDVVVSFWNLTETIATLIDSGQLSNEGLEGFKSSVWSDIVRRLGKRITPSEMAAIAAAPVVLAIDYGNVNQALVTVQNIVIVANKFIQRFDGLNLTVESLFRGAPQLTNIALLWKDHLIDILSVLVSTTFKSPVKVIKELRSWNQFCEWNPEDYFTFPKSRPVDLQGIHSSICSVDPLILLEELKEMIDLKTLTTVSKCCVNITTTLQMTRGAEDLVNTISSMVDSPLKVDLDAIWPNDSQWKAFESVIDEEVHNLASPENIRSLAVSVVEEVNHNMDATLAILALQDVMQWTTSALNLAKGGYVWKTVTSYYSDRTEAKKIIDLIDRTPDAIATVILSAYNFDKVINLIMDLVLDYFPDCSTDFSLYLTAPTGSDILILARNIVCHTNFKRLAVEILPINRALLVYRNAEVNITSFGADVEKLVSVAIDGNTFVQKMPLLEPEWLRPFIYGRGGSDVVNDAMHTWERFLKDPDHKLIDGVVTLLSGFLKLYDRFSYTNRGIQMLEDYLAAVAEKTVYLKDEPVVSLKMLFPESPLMYKYVQKWTSLFPQVVQTLLWMPKWPLLSPDLDTFPSEKEICDNVSKWLYNPSLSEETWESFGLLVCYSPRELEEEVNTYFRRRPSYERRAPIHWVELEEKANKTLHFLWGLITDPPIVDSTDQPWLKAEVWRDMVTEFSEETEATNGILGLVMYVLPDGDLKRSFTQRWKPVTVAEGFVEEIFSLLRLLEKDPHFPYDDGARTAACVFEKWFFSQWMQRAYQLTSSGAPALEALLDSKLLLNIPLMNMHEDVELCSLPYGLRSYYIRPSLKYKFCNSSRYFDDIYGARSIQRIQMHYPALDMHALLMDLCKEDISEWINIFRKYNLGAYNIHNVLNLNSLWSEDSYDYNLRFYLPYDEKMKLFRDTLPVNWDGYEETLKLFIRIGAENQKLSTKQIVEATIVTAEAIFIHNLVDIWEWSVRDWFPTASASLDFMEQQLNRLPEYRQLLCNLHNSTFMDMYNVLAHDMDLIKDVKNIYEVSRNKKVMELYLNMSNLDMSKTISAEMANVSFLITEELLGLIFNDARSAQVYQCIGTLKDSPLWKDTTVYVDLLFSLLTVIKEIDSTDVSSISDGIDTIFQIIGGEVTVYKPMTESLRKNNTLRIEWEDLGVRNDYIDAVMQAYINVNRAVAVKFRGSSFAKIFKSNELLPKLLKLEDENDISYQMLTEEFEQLNVEALGDSLSLNLDRNHINFKIGEWRMDVITSKEWYSNATQRLKNIITNIHSINADTDLSFLDSGHLRLSNLGEGLLSLFQDYSLNKLIVGLEDLVEDLQPLFPDSVVLEALQKVLEGLKSLKILKQMEFLNMRFKVEKLFKNWNEIKDILVYDLGVQPETADAVHGSTLSLTAMLSGNFDRRMLCYESRFREILSLSYEDARRAARDFCSLDDEQLKQLGSVLLSNLDLGTVATVLLDASFGALAEKANMTVDEAEETMDNLKQVSKVIPELMNTFNNITTSMNMSQSKEEESALEGSVQALTAPQALRTAGNLICGQPLDYLEDKFKILRKSTLNLLSKASRIDQEELASLPTEFCKNVYKNIMKLSGGSVIWTYLKPVARGRILYTPDTPAARRIIREANNTFDSLSSMMQLAAQFGESTIAVRDLGNMEEEVENTKDLFSSSLMKEIFSKVMEEKGIDAKFLLNLNMSRIMNVIRNSEGLLNMSKLVGDIVRCSVADRFIGFDSEEEMEVKAKHFHNTNEYFAGIVFLNLNKNDGKRKKREDDSSLPPHVQYKIRMDIDNMPLTGILKLKFWRPGPEDNFVNEMRYFRGFIQLQDMIETAIIKLQAQNNMHEDTGIYLQQMPYPCYTKNLQGSFMMGMIPVVFSFACLFLVALIVRQTRIEDEASLSQVQQVMGLRSWIGWLAWFLSAFLTLFLVALMLWFMLTFAKILPYSNPTITFLFLLVFIFSLTMFCYMVSSLFYSAMLASLTAVALYLVTYLPFIIVLTLEFKLGFVVEIISCLLMSTAFSFGTLYISRYEEQAVGMQWDLVWKSPISGDEMNLGWSCVMILVDSFIYFLIGWYIANVWPVSPHAYKRPWYFLFTLRYWGFGRFGGKSKFSMSESDEFIAGSPESSVLYKSLQRGLWFSKRMNRRSASAVQLSNLRLSGSETENTETSKTQEVGIVLHHLRKVFNPGTKSEKVAVEDLSVEFYQGEITTLLGQNGAGKTTAINMLTGMYAPSSGAAYIYGKSLAHDWPTIRKMVGVCPQHNILFPLLSPREHLLYYGKLKGLYGKKKLKADINDLLESMGLWDLQNMPSKNLSGGMKRRLSVAIAFVGGSKVVVLDEPSSGVDPVARRHIWELILKHKEGRTIVLTTHHLDEADILSDRVAILHQGKLLCCGSPMYLKSRFGAGYKLVVSKNPSESDSDSGQVSSSGINECMGSFNLPGMYSLLRKYIPNALLVEEVGSELVFSLPYFNQLGEPNRFQTVFEALEMEQESLGFGSYGLSCTTMEEVFLTVCAQADAGVKVTPVREISSPGQYLYLRKGSTIGDENGLPPTEVEVSQDIWVTKALNFGSKEAHTGLRLKTAQFSALIYKRFWHHLRDWRFLVSNIVLPVIVMAIAMGCSMLRPEDDTGTNIMLTPSLYGPGAVSFYSPDKPIRRDLQLIADSLMKPPGIGTTCLAPELAEQHGMPPCKYTESGFHTDYEHPTSNDNPRVCVCTSKGQQCSGDYLGYTPPRWTTNTTDIVYDLTDLDLNHWIMNSFPDFIEKRYGGWSFEEAPGTIGLPGTTEKVVVWYNNKGYHSMPAYLNAANNARLRAAVGKDSHKYGITAFNHPVKFSKYWLGFKTLTQKVTDTGISLLMLMAFCFIPAGCVVYVVNERLNQEKRLQHISGVGPTLYWLSALFWDTLMLVIAVALTGLVMQVFGVSIFTARLNFPAVILLLFLFGMSTLPLLYLVSRLFQSASLAYMVLFCLNMFVGIVTMCTVLILSFYYWVPALIQISSMLEYVFLIFPQFVLTHGMWKLTSNQLLTDIFERFGDDVYLNPFSTDMLAYYYIILVVQGILFFVINLLLEYRFTSVKNGKGKPYTSNQSEDPDVMAERKRIQNSENSDDILKVENLTKVYHTLLGKKTVVKDLSLAVPDGECFGLLGFNGAGKTTTFRMLTGDLEPTRGSATIRSNGSIADVIRSGGQLVGYCPQTDALDNTLTTRQMLKVYAELRGIPKHHIQQVVDRALHKFALRPYASQQCYTLSGGNKRKLSAAISLLGDPLLVLMDEPTSGMDPASRRLVWSVVQQVVRERRSVILSSHTMDECDALCTRLAIMVNGRFVCLGAPQYLKHRFGGGYTLLFRVAEWADLGQVMSFVHTAFPMATLKSQHHSTLEFRLPRHSVPLSAVFGKLEESQETVGILDFSVTQTTLDQVFVNFARLQSDGVEDMSTGGSDLGADNYRLGAEFYGRNEDKKIATTKF